MPEMDPGEIAFNECRHRLKAVESAMRLLSDAQSALPVYWHNGHRVSYETATKEGFALAHQQLNAVHWELKQEFGRLGGVERERQHCDFPVQYAAPH